MNIRICGIECWWGSDLPPILPLTWSPLVLVQCKWDLLYQWSPNAHSHTCLFTTSMIWSLWWFWDITNSQTSNPVDFDVFYVASLNFHQPRQKARLIERWLGPILILYFVSCDAFTYYTMPSMIRLSVSPNEQLNIDLHCSCVRTCFHSPSPPTPSLWWLTAHFQMHWRISPLHFGLSWVVRCAIIKIRFWSFHSTKHCRSGRLCAASAPHNANAVHHPLELILHYMAFSAPMSVG